MVMFNVSLIGLIRHFTSMWLKTFIQPIGAEILMLSYRQGRYLMVTVGAINKA